ncbi:hypothetical protein Tco_0786956, partial [Tanacetum coccineum]
IVMLDLKDSTVTYTAVSSPFEGLSDIGSPGVDGPPMMPEDPYTYVVAAFQAPPSPDYVSGLDEPEQAPFSPEFVPEPVYPEFIPSEDEVFPAEEQPLHAVVSPTADSPGYIVDSNPEEDPEEDPTDYPDDGGDDIDDDDESSDDDEDDDDDVEEDGDEEEEHTALANSVLPPVHHVTARMSIREQPPIPFWSEAEIARLLAIPLPPPSPLSPWHHHYFRFPHHHYQATMIRLRAETPSTSHPLPSSTPPLGTSPLLSIPLATSSPPMLLPSTFCRAGIFEVKLPPQKRLCTVMCPRYEVGESSRRASTLDWTRGFRADYSFVATLDMDIRRDPERDVGYGITDTWDEMLKGMPGAPATDETELGLEARAVLSGWLNLLGRDRCSHAYTALLIEREARLSREAWGRVE